MCAESLLGLFLSIELETVFHDFYDDGVKLISLFYRATCMERWLSVCASVCPSQAGIVDLSKQLNPSSS